VNNAGIVYLAELEMTSVKLFRKVLDVNLLGVINVTKTFLPLVRLAKGRIVNMSSITGLTYSVHSRFCMQCLCLFTQCCLVDVVVHEIALFD